MMDYDPALMDYVQNQIRKGYSLDYIKNFLLDQGYDSSQVGKIAEAVEHDRLDSIKSYINQEINAGYNINDIRARLLSYGYQPEEVDKAMKSGAKKSTNIPVIAVIAVLIIIGGILYFIVSPSDDTPGVSFDEGDDEQELDSEDDVGIAPVVDIEEEEETEQEQETPPEIPEPEETEFDRVEKVYEVINASQDEKIMRAVQMCENTANEIYKDACFDQLSKATRDHSLCLKISDLQQRDQCFKRTAIYTQNENICEEISDPALKSECMMYDYA
ncbi:hypothetical protein GF345_02005 [Candidatus Woesearchaeota archaeon]|nr:hypothetical protein [Candidatus Woesearchaeota archaeon]